MTQNEKNFFSVSKNELEKVLMIGYGVKRNLFLVAFIGAVVQVVYSEIGANKINYR